MSHRKEWSSPRGARQNTPTGEPLHFRMESIGPLGMVFHCDRPCEEGTAMALGFHLQKGAEAPVKMALEGVVVDCRPIRHQTSFRGGFRVTLLFHSLTDAQREVLGKAAFHVAGGGGGPPVSVPFPVSSSGGGFEGYPPVCGLN